MDEYELDILRDAFAMHMENPIKGIGIEQIAAAAGMDEPAYGLGVPTTKEEWASHHKWYAEAEARVRYIKADIMLKVRNEGRA